MLTRPTLRLVISNNRTPSFDKPCARSPIAPLNSSVTLKEIMKGLEELLYLKPTYVGGIVVLVRDQVERMRAEHPTRAREYAASVGRRLERSAIE